MTWRCSNCPRSGRRQLRPGILARSRLDRDATGASVVVQQAEPAGHDVRPDASNARAYDALFAVYVTLYPQLREVFASLASASRGTS